MNCIIVDDEQLAREGFINLCESIEELVIVADFCDPVEAYEFLLHNSVNIVFLDVEMPVMNGVELGRKIHEMENPPYIVYLTSYSEYAFDAFQVDASSYLLKPMNAKDIQHSVEKILSGQKPPHDKQVQIRCFGNFDCFINGRLLQFKHPRAKELLAILVDGRGGHVSSARIMDYMFDGKSLDDRLRVIYRKSRMYLKSVLRENNLADIVIFSKGGCYIDTTKVQCDYFDYLAHDPKAKEAFRGEYMTNYSWSENTLGLLMFHDDDL